MYDRHEVSVKVALYSSDGKRALLMYYPRDDGFGLPGGGILTLAKRLTWH